MDEIKVSLDKARYSSKPTDRDAALINKRIGKNVKMLNSENMYSFAFDVGQNGHTFSPATFLNGSKKQDHFEQMQMLVLDFDGGISFESVRDRAEQYELSILSAYDTFSSTDHDRFRVMFLNDVPITDGMAAKIYKSALMTIFPEADKSDIDISKMYYGGKELMYFDQSLPTIDLESTLRNMTYYLENRHGPTHYKNHIRKFAEKHKIRLNKKGLLDISDAVEATELMGTSSPGGKNSPNAIIFYKRNGDFLPNSCYRIHLEEDGTSSSSVSKAGSKYHLEYRPDVLGGISRKCQLYREFESGERRLHHHELFGIATNLIQVESGIKTFNSILRNYSDHYDDQKQKKWDSYIKYFRDQKYSPCSCDVYCEYRDTCVHGKNLLTTVKPRRGTMEKLSSCMELYCSIEEAQEDLMSNLELAIDADDARWHIIKAQTAIGKTESYLNQMKRSEEAFLIVVPTNKLKWDVKRRADQKGIELEVTPSLDEIKDEMPDYIWEQIQFLRETGQHSKVHPFIGQMADEEDEECLKEYLKKQEELETYSGNLITTHRRFLNMDKRALEKYSVIIIDEDIILSSIAPNQCEISVSELKRILHEAKKEKPKHGKMKELYKMLIKKMKKLLDEIETNTLIELHGFEWDPDKDEDEETGEEDEDGITAMTDIPSFCLAEHFICRKADEEKNLSEDSVVFIKPFHFKNIKHIMVSATVDKDICEYCFGKENVKFYECKQARYAGTLNQYYDKPMSRTCIDEEIGILKRISDWSGFKHMITFKKYGIDDMYFGNAIGCDYLRGQNIDIIGTPYQVDFLYKLLPFALGLDVDEDAKMKSCRVCHNGYMFTFTTYGEEHDVLRKFHFWMIESELEQAVGRARLLRCDCTVNLFSNFPLKQAVMKETEYNN